MRIWMIEEKMWRWSKKSRHRVGEDILGDLGIRDKDLEPDGSSDVLRSLYRDIDFDVEGAGRPMYLEFNENVDLKGAIKLDVGMKFSTPSVFRKFLRTYAI